MKIFCPQCQAGYEIDDELLKIRARRVKCGSCGEVFTVDKIEEDQEDAFAMLADAMEKEDDVLAAIEEQIEPQGQSEIKEQIKPQEQSEIKDKQESEDKTVALPEESNNSSGETTENEPSDQEDEDSAIDIEDIFERLSETAEHIIIEEKKLPFYKKIWLGIKNIFGLGFFSLVWASSSKSLFSHRFILLMSRNRQAQRSIIICPEKDNYVQKALLRIMYSTTQNIPLRKDCTLILKISIP